MWSQTPQFTLKLEPFEGADLELNVHHGVIKALDGTCGPDGNQAVEKIRNALVGQKMQEIGNWNMFLRKRIQPWDDKCNSLTKRLEEMLPIPKMRGS